VAQDTLQLGCCLYFHQAPGEDSDVLEEAFDNCYELVLDALAENPRLSLNLHFSGNVLEHALARRPAFLDRLAGLWRDGQVELLGGAFYGPILAAIPERDALGQLQHTSNFYKQHLGRSPLGAWLSLRAWDATLPAVLSGAGLHYTLLDAGHFVSAGCLPTELNGYYTTERAGQNLGLFPLNGSLAKRVADSEGDLGAYLAELAGQHSGEDSFQVFALEGHGLVRSGGLQVLTEKFLGESHWLKSELLQNLFERHASRGRVYLPACVYPLLSRWLRPAPAARRYRELSDRLEELGALEEARPLLGSMVWQNALVKYPEANRLHKRMLRVSHRIDLLRQVVHASERQGNGGAGLEQARGLLRQCCTALWRSQQHAAYWHGLGALPGIYDPRLRYVAMRHLVVADRIVDRLMKDPCQENWTFQRADFDADGAEEILVRTPHFSSLVHPGKGGGLWELDLRSTMIPLQTSFSPVDEPVVPRLEGNEICLVFDDDDELAAWEASAADRSTANGAPPAGRRRGAFQDHFLGSETTLQNFAQRQFRELGNFAGMVYEVLPVLRPEEHGKSGCVTVGRSGVVKDVNSTHLLRIEKSYRFEVANPRLEFAVEILNRSRDAARVWYGVEWTFGIPSGELADLAITATSPEDQQIVAQLSDGPVDLGVRSWLEWQDPGSGLCIVVTFERPMGVWWLPVSSDHEGPDGRTSSAQGNTLLLHEHLEIWGEESRTLSFRVDFLTDTA